MGGYHPWIQELRSWQNCSLVYQPLLRAELGALKLVAVASIYISFIGIQKITAKQS